MANVKITELQDLSSSANSDFSYDSIALSDARDVSFIVASRPLTGKVNDAADNYKISLSAVQAQPLARIAEIDKSVADANNSINTTNTNVNAISDNVSNLSAFLSSYMKKASNGKLPELSDEFARYYTSENVNSISNSISNAISTDLCNYVKQKLHNDLTAQIQAIKTFLSVDSTITSTSDSGEQLTTTVPSSVSSKLASIEGQVDRISSQISSVDVKSISSTLDILSGYPRKTESLDYYVRGLAYETSSQFEAAFRDVPSSLAMAYSISAVSSDEHGNRGFLSSFPIDFTETIPSSYALDDDGNQEYETDTNGAPRYDESGKKIPKIHPAVDNLRHLSHLSCVYAMLDAAFLTISALQQRIVVLETCVSGYDDASSEEPQHISGLIDKTSELFSKASCISVELDEAGQVSATRLAVSSLSVGGQPVSPNTSDSSSDPS